MDRIALIALVGLLPIGAAVGQQPTPTAQAAMTDTQGKAVGRVTLTQMPKGVLIRAELAGLPAGWHGLHLHEIGECAPPFSSAGAHVNPGNDKHGLIEGGSHAGDLPNVHVGADGRAMAEMMMPDLALSEATAAGSGIVHQAVQAVRNAVGAGTVNQAVGTVRNVVGVGAVNLLDANGSAIVVHAKADDHRTDPAGGSGDRIACGVITRS
jgi:Cu-Zn family superoxide dismutase